MAGQNSDVRVPAVHLNRTPVHAVRGELNEWGVFPEKCHSGVRVTATCSHGIRDDGVELGAISITRKWRRWSRRRLWWSEGMALAWHRRMGRPYEYARMRRLYDRMALGESNRIEFFNGPHTIQTQKGL